MKHGFYDYFSLFVNNWKGVVVGYVLLAGIAGVGWYDKFITVPAPVAVVEEQVSTVPKHTHPNIVEKLLREHIREYH